MTIFNSYVSSPEGTLYFADLLVMCVALVGDFPPAVAAGSQPTPGWVRGDLVRSPFQCEAPGHDSSVGANTL